MTLSAPRLMAALLAVVAVLGGLYRHVAGGTADTRPIELPETFHGRERLAGGQDFGGDPAWRQGAVDDVAGAGLAGAAYGTPQQGRINVVAARADLSGKLDLRLAADDGTPYGAVRCTRHLDLSTQMLKGPPATYDRLVLCWRRTPALSVSAFALSASVPPEELATSLEILYQDLAAAG